jgi:hypothetical protein
MQMAISVMNTQSKSSIKVELPATADNLQDVDIIRKGRLY